MAGGSKCKPRSRFSYEPAPGAPPLNTYPLSQTIEDWYRFENSPQFRKTTIRFVPPSELENLQAVDGAIAPSGPNWYVVDASETGNPYCTQGFTYPFAMEATEGGQPHSPPAFYEQYAPYYSYEKASLADFGLVFTY